MNTARDQLKRRCGLFLVAGQTIVVLMAASLLPLSGRHLRPQFTLSVD